MSLTAETRLSPSGLAYLNPPAPPMFFIGTLSQTLTLRAAFASSTYLLSQIPGPGRSSDDDLLIPLIPFSGGTSRPSCAPERMATASLFFGRHLMIYLNPPDPLFKGAIRAFGLSIAARLPCPPTPARHLMMPCCWVAEHDHFCQRKLSPHHRHSID